MMYVDSSVFCPSWVRISFHGLDVNRTTSNKPHDTHFIVAGLLGKATEKFLDGSGNVLICAMPFADAKSRQMKLLERALFIAKISTIGINMIKRRLKINMRSQRPVSAMAACQAGISVVVGGLVRTAKAVAFGILL
jgi:hypothetical protein